MTREYRVIVATTQAGLQAVAQRVDGWTLLRNTEFSALDSDHDVTLGDIGSLAVSRSGWVALAYRDVSA
jgi:hypothetical protein